MTPLELATEPTFIPTLRSQLADVFDSPFAFWSYSDTGWSRLDDDSHAFSLDSTTVPLDALLEHCTETIPTEPVLLPLGKRQRWLVLPLSCDQTEVLATTQVTATAGPAATRTARLFTKAFHHEATISRLHEENERLIARTYCNLEELSFLRDTVAYVAGPQRPHSQDNYCEGLLPRLQRYIHVEGVAFVPAKSGMAKTPDFAKFQWHGEDSVDRKEAERLIENYYSDSLQSPVVRKLFDNASESRRYSTVRDFVLLPIQESDQIWGWLAVMNRCDPHVDESDPKETREPRGFGTGEVAILRSAGTVIALQDHNETLLAEKEQLLSDLVAALVSALESKDVYTRGHSQRVAAMSQKLARRIGMPERSCQQMYLTGLLHDIGKIGLNDATLAKPGRLTRDEFEEIKRIPQSGWAILHDLQALGFVLPGVLHHHENYDGSGYPDGLHGEAIPLEGRIIGIADAYDAMISDRPYREGMSHETVAEVMTADGGKQWDPTLVALLFQMNDEPQATPARPVSCLTP